jgi:TolA-binding protein
LLARQNLVAAVGALFLSVGATAAWAATDEERSQPRGGESQGSETESSESRGSKSRGDASGSTEPRSAESRSSLRATLREDRLPKERQTEPQSEPQPDRAAAAGETVAGVPTATLEAIASCESGGDPTAVSADGTYRGKYQFDTGTWASVGGSGDPAAAPEAEQDYRAALLYAQSGPSQWPMCGQ